MRHIASLLLALALSLPGVLRAQGGQVQVGDVRLHYELGGEGPPLVLIHGWTHDLRSWDLQARALEREFTVLRYDRRGWGESEGHADTSMDPVDLAALLDSLGLESAGVLGHSQGADVALRFALAYPERVDALVLYGAPPPAGLGLPWTGPDALPPDLPAIARDHGLDSLGAVIFSHPLARGFEEGEPGTELARLLWADYDGEDLLEPRPLSGATPPPHVDRMGEIAAPTLVVTGEWEMPYFQVVAEALAYAIPGATRLIVEGGGHAVHMQAPERFTEEVVRFLRGERPEGASSAWPTCRPGQVRAMLLGTYHMANPGLDEINVDAGNVLEPARQRELEELAERLARWEPDRIAVEWRYTGQARADSLYGAYRAGEPVESRDEVVQVGFRLAAMLGHERVHAVDYTLRLGNDSLAALSARGFSPPDKIDYPRRGPAEIERESQERLVRSTIPQYLRWLNQEERLRVNHDLMFPNLRKGDGDNFGGAQMLAAWYERNLRMAHLIWRAVEAGDERMLVIVGSGHVRPLRHLLDEAPMFCPVSPLPHLDGIGEDLDGDGRTG